MNRQTVTMYPVRRKSVRHGPYDPDSRLSSVLMFLLKISFLKTVIILLKEFVF